MTKIKIEELAIREKKTMNMSQREQRRYCREGLDKTEKCENSLVL